MASLPRATPAAAHRVESPSKSGDLSRALIIDGLRLWVRAWPGGGPPLMLLHGGMAHAGWWGALAPEIAAFSRPFALDRRGHGESEWTEPSRYGWSRDIADIEEAMQRLDDRPWVLAGHSQGGLLAAEIAVARRVALMGLVLVDAPLEPRSPELRRTGRALRRMPQIHYAALADAVRRFQPFPPRHHIPAELLRRLAEESFQATADGRYTSRFHWQRFQNDEDPENHPLNGFAERLRGITVPTLVLRGAESTILSEGDFAEMVRRMPGARGVAIPGSTHHLHVEQPTLVAAAIRDFLAALPAPPSGGGA